MSRMIDFIGICRKAGGLTYGYEQTSDGMKRGKVVLILVTSDISPKTLKEINFGNKENIPLVHLKHTKDELKQVLKSACGILGITDENLSKKIISLADGESKEE